MAGPTNPLTYNDYVTQVATMTIVQTTMLSGVVVGVDPAFNIIIPQMLQYAETRIQRDLELLPLQSSHDSYFLPPNANTLQIPIGDFFIIQTVELIAQDGSSTPVLPTSREFIQNVYGSPSVKGQPQYFNMYGGDYITSGQTYNNLLFGPYADQQYAILLTGQIRMPSLYLQANTANAASGLTWISTWMPDLLVQASMIYVSQYQRNFLPTSNDPEMPGSYENQYQALLAGARGEEFRKKFEGSAWTAMATSPVATPAR